MLFLLLSLFVASFVLTLFRLTLFLVLEALDALVAGDRTVISIAHRLSTMRAADAIAVMKEGKVVEVGTYAGVMMDMFVYVPLHFTRIMLTL